MKNHLFRDRAPITEAGFCGLACGAAMNGMHPVVELMFSSFGLVAADQLFNQIGQLGHIYNGQVRIPLEAVGSCQTGVDVYVFGITRKDRAEVFRCMPRGSVFQIGSGVVQVILFGALHPQIHSNSNPHPEAHPSNMSPICDSFCEEPMANRVEN